MKTNLILLFCSIVIVTLVVFSVSRYEKHSIEVSSTERVVDINEIADDMTIDVESFRDLTSVFQFSIHAISLATAVDTLHGQTDFWSPHTQFRHLRI
ncbi:MAG: hypothetical protein GX556_11430 [Fibrobacter sp.]|nr:hypothetical protein [Fibrobacter sp.]